MRKLTQIFLILVIALAGIVAIQPGGRMEAKTQNEQPKQISSFEQAVAIIKKYETLNSASHWPYVGYGHRVMPGEKYRRGVALSEKEADALLRKDLQKNCAVFRDLGPDSLIMGVLAYSIGPGAAKKSSVYTKLKNGDRNIRESYLAHSRYRGKVHAGIKKRRVEEFEALFIKEDVPSSISDLIETVGGGYSSLMLADMDEKVEKMIDVLSPPWHMVKALAS